MRHHFALSWKNNKLIPTILESPLYNLDIGVKPSYTFHTVSLVYMKKNNSLEKASAALQ